MQGASAQHLRAHTGDARVGRPPDSLVQNPSLHKNSPLERFLVQRRFKVEFRCNAATQLTAAGWISPDVRCLLEADMRDGCAEPWAKVLEAMRSFARGPSSARRPYCLKPSEKRSKVYGVAEYLMMLQEVETVRLNRQAREGPTRSRNEMEDRRVPDLEEMDEQEAYRFLTELLTNLSPEEEYNVRHQDYVMEMPQSGERFRGRENMRAFQEAYPTRPPSIRLRRVLVKEGLWVVEGVTGYGGGQVSDLVLILELRDGRCGETDGTSPSRLRRRSGGRSGSSGWNPKARKAHLNFRGCGMPEA